MSQFNPVVWAVEGGGAGLPVLDPADLVFRALLYNVLSNFHVKAWEGSLLSIQYGHLKSDTIVGPGKK